MLKTDDLTLVLTNRQKVFWPEHGYTKGDLLDYYRDIAPVMVPYLRDRPQVLHRHVDGHQGKEFFQRVSKHRPSWVQTAKVPTSKKTYERDFILCQNWPRCCGWPTSHAPIPGRAFHCPIPCQRILA
jgi:bifunctional non-homologous end joining protein LigD